MKATSPSRAIRAVATNCIKVPRWKVRFLINSIVLWKGESLTAIITIGIDLAKNVFAVHGEDSTGKPALVRPNVPRPTGAEGYAFARSISDSGYLVINPHLPSFFSEPRAPMAIR